MAYRLFTRVALKQNIPRYKLQHGDVATIVEIHPGRPDQEMGYTLEVFNAIGDTLAVITVEESQIEALTVNEVLHIRHLNEAAA